MSGITININFNSISTTTNTTTSTTAAAASVEEDSACAAGSGGSSDGNSSSNSNNNNDSSGVVRSGKQHDAQGEQRSSEDDDAELADLQPVATSQSLMDLIYSTAGGASRTCSSYTGSCKTAPVGPAASALVNTVERETASETPCSRLVHRVRDRLRVRNKYKAVSFSLRALMLLSVSCTVVVAVVVPWYLAKQAGEDSVKKAISPLLFNVAAKAEAALEKFFGEAVAAAAEASEDITLSYDTESWGVSNENFRELEHLFQRVGTRISPNYYIRYIYWAGTNGEMACIEFDELNNNMAIQEVRLLANGSLSSELNWELDANGENTGYPTSNYSDLGQYEVLSWLPEYLDQYVWDNDPYVETSTEGTYELVMSYYAPIFNSVGVYVGVLGVDMCIKQVAELFRENAQQQQVHGGHLHGMAFLCQPNGLVLACSPDEPVTLDEENLRYAQDYDDELMASVASGIEHRQKGDAPFASSSMTFFAFKAQYDGRSEETYDVLVPVVGATFTGLNWTMVVGLPESDFTRKLQHDTRITLAVALVVLAVGVSALCTVLLLLTHRISALALRIHSIEDTATDMSLDSGMSKVLNQLTEIANNSDAHTKAQLQGVIELLVSSANSGALYKPSVNTDRLDPNTKQWFLAEFGGGQESNHEAEVTLTLEDRVQSVKANPAPLGKSPLTAAGRSPLLEAGKSPFLLGGKTPLLVPKTPLNTPAWSNEPPALLDELPLQSDSLNELAEAESPSSVVGQMGFGQWVFNLFDLAALLPDTSALVECGCYALSEDTCVSVLQQPGDKVRRFMEAVEDTYNHVPYHSSMHAADVLQAVYFFTHGEARTFLTPMEMFALQLAAILHDANHMGTNNNFQIAVESELAMLYNDTSVMENHHLCVGLKLLKQFDMLCNLTPTSRKMLRKLLIALILSTDMALHWQIMGEFKTQFEHSQLDRNNADHRLMLMKFMLKMADISNVARPMSLMLEWQSRLNKEFYSQGDLEKKLGLPVAAFMDRAQATDLSKAQTQVNFIRFVAYPLFESFSRFIPIPEVMWNLEQSRTYWSGRVMTFGGTSQMVQVISSSTPSLKDFVSHSSSSQSQLSLTAPRLMLPLGGNAFTSTNLPPSARPSARPPLSARAPAALAGNANSLSATPGVASVGPPTARGSLFGRRNAAVAPTSSDSLATTAPQGPSGSLQASRLQQRASTVMAGGDGAAGERQRSWVAPSNILT
eukprot:TRINITY_DN3415_c0_g1_i1.p1 TRINITY_DN3415_c0_g1~~TRINITY_DN3415_c0_g1_i1.p1  ORF type:complete len:1223 (-),score=292.70 TRINITY_DN3415_c0_g1_i1:1-3642(-)